MAEVASFSSDESPNVLAFPDCLTGTRVAILIGPVGGKLLSPKELRAQIMRVLKLIKRHKWFFAHKCSPCGRVPLRLMLPCVAFACHRLATAPADTHMAHMSWSWA
jgi:hypothetical protein